MFKFTFSLFAVSVLSLATAVAAFGRCETAADAKPLANTAAGQALAILIVGGDELDLDDDDAKVSCEYPPYKGGYLLSADYPPYKGGYPLLAKKPSGNGHKISEILL